MEKKVDRLQKTLEDVFGFMRISPKYTVSEGSDAIDVAIDGEDLSFLIGYRGESLYALQSFLGMVINKDSADWVRLSVDINDYRKQREEKLEDVVRSFIDRVRFFGKEIEMSPMNASERFFVHTYVSEYDDVTSESIGEGATRRVVLKPVALKE